MKNLMIAFILCFALSINGAEQPIYIPGHWVQVEGQYVWITGYSQQSPQTVVVQQSVVYVQQSVQTVYVEQSRPSFVFYGSFGFNSCYSNRGCFVPFIGHRR